MSNYYGNGRSNYVKFTDPEKAEKIANIYGLQMQLEQGKKDSYLIFAGNDNEDGDTQNHFYIGDADDLQALKDAGFNPENEDEEEYELPDFMDSIAKVLHPDHVFIWQHVGNEKLRYLCGYSVAVNSEGKTVTVNIDEIYTKAAELGKIVNCPH